MPTAIASHTTSLRAALGSSSALPDSALPLEDGAGNGTSPVSGAFARAENARSDTAAADWAFEAARNRALRTRPAQKCFIIYAIRSWEAKDYVGVTVSLRMRIARDIGDALHRPHLGGPGSLLDAIRRAFKAGKTFEQAFQVRSVALALTEDEARRLEREWIERIGAMSPRGYNLAPGGLSLGGPFNAKPVTIKRPAKGALHYDSLMKAIDSINAMRTATGEVPLGLYTVYMRLRMGWPAEEALGLWAHADRRRERAEFVWGGRRYTSLRALARAEGVPIDTARWKLQRARWAGCAPGHDAAQDRRYRRGCGTGTGAGGRRTRLVLPHPQLQGEVVNAKTFAALSNVPHATVVYRCQQLIRQGRDPACMPRSELLPFLTTDQDRRVVVTLRLPDGCVLRDGVRALIAQVLDNPALETSREERIGFSSIRKRLREIPGWPACRGRESEVRWAFGFKRNGRWPGHRRC